MNGIWKKMAIASTVCIAFNLAAFLWISPVVTHKERDKIAKKMRAVKPDIVFLGNSMLRANLEERDVARAFHKKVLKIQRGGSASASWFLTLKNVVARAAKKPSHAIVFFRDYYLTMPEYRAVGRYTRYIRDLADANEPLLERLSYKTAPADIVLARVFPLFRSRSEIREGLDLFVKETVVSRLMGKDAAFAQSAVNEVFHDKNMDPALLTKKQLAAESSEDEQEVRFADVIEDSYLPAMIQVAKDAGIQLIFVRVKRRRDAEGRIQPPSLKQYTADLRRYLNTQHIPLIDFSDEPSILPEHFGAGDHLARKTGRPLFTKLLIQRLDRYLQPSPSPDTPRFVPAPPE